MPIKTREELLDEIKEAWEEIEDHTPSDEALGKGFRDYVIQNIMDMDWEGYTDKELAGVKTFLKDYGLYILYHTASKG